jgi:hypothetical protein
MNEVELLYVLVFAVSGLLIWYHKHAMQQTRSHAIEKTAVLIHTGELVVTAHTNDNGDDVIRLDYKET